MGASGTAKREDNYLSSLLLSFIKINKFTSEFKSKKKEELSKLSEIYYSLIKNQNECKPYIEQFKRMLTIEKGEPDTLGTNEILEYILEQLYEESNQSKEEDKKLKRGFNSVEELENYLEKNNSFILQLFSWTKKNNLINKPNNCLYESKPYGIQLLEYFDSSLKEGENNILNLVNDNLKTTFTCNCCKKLIKIESSYNESPEIYILCFNKKKIRTEDYIINYYLNCTLNENKYNLIGFIIQKNENNEKDDNYNIFYKEDGKWYLYKTKEMTKIYIPKITKIKGNPLVAFYQQENWLENYYNKLSILLEDKNSIIEQIRGHIVESDIFDDYYLVDKKWYNKILKIYESDEIYSNDSKKINSIKDLSNIFTLNNKELKEKKKNFNKHRKYLIKKESFEPKIAKNEFDENNNYKYPKDFLLITKNILEDLLKSLVYDMKEFGNSLYSVKLGENYAFIKNKYKGEEIYYAYTFEENKFELAVIFKYHNKDFFSQEMKKYISNKGGLEYYYRQRGLNLKNKEQKIINKENDEIGSLINVRENHINLSKYEIDDTIVMSDINPNIKNDDSIDIKMSMFPNETIVNDNQIESPNNIRPNVNENENNKINVNNNIINNNYIKNKSLNKNSNNNMINNNMANMNNIINTNNNNLKNNNMLNNNNINNMNK
jgi:hypothetical protein